MGEVYSLWSKPGALRALQESARRWKATVHEIELDEAADVAIVRLFSSSVSEGAGEVLRKASEGRWSPVSDSAGLLARKA